MYRYTPAQSPSAAANAAGERRIRAAEARAEEAEAKVAELSADLNAAEKVNGELGRRVATGEERTAAVGLCTSSIRFTHSLKTPGLFQPLSAWNVISWFFKPLISSATVLPLRRGDASGGGGDQHR